eukprot:CAMPEP_0168352790 /NCGR_PEP_ID=MMETSP0213-20121227/22803_1 /TAXON_ID=151035 /ORGANISM="Euplotes harpa, Strain FSP1.4" /LENGTH=101 /DNA_ID=CAMNT_0008364153 /DNA_START=669 /DNA_END=975 /DNA_ORIENTATION=+
MNLKLNLAKVYILLQIEFSDLVKASFRGLIFFIRIKIPRALRQNENNRGITENKNDAHTKNRASLPPITRYTLDIMIVNHSPVNMSMPKVLVEPSGVSSSA